MILRIRYRCCTSCLFLLVLAQASWWTASALRSSQAASAREEGLAADLDGAHSEAERALQCVASERLMFLHIPKTAGTAVEDAGKLSGVNWGRFMDFSTCGRPKQCQALWHEPPGFFKAVNMYTTAKVFCVVR